MRENRSHGSTRGRPVLPRRSTLHKIPPGIELDLYKGKAWLGIVPFRMEEVTRRGFSAPSFPCDFPEINVRTYVTMGGKPGVWFFSLDVPNRLMVLVARTLFYLPYFKAEMTVGEDEAAIRYSVRRGGRQFDASYSPAEAHPGAPGSFEEWATERYCLYSSAGKTRLFRAEVHHKQWPLERARLELANNDLAEFSLGEMHPMVLFPVGSTWWFGRRSEWIDRLGWKQNSTVVFRGAVHRPDHEPAAVLVHVDHRCGVGVAGLDVFGAGRFEGGGGRSGRRLRLQADISEGQCRCRRQ